MTLGYCLLKSNITKKTLVFSLLLNEKKSDRKSLDFLPNPYCFVITPLKKRNKIENCYIFYLSRAGAYPFMKKNTYVFLLTPL